MTLFWQMYWMTCLFYCHINYFTFSHHFASDVSFGIIKHLLTRYSGNSKFNRFLHTFLGKTGWSSTSDRNFISFREWSAAKQAKRHTNFYHSWKITRAFPTTHVSTYFFRKSTTLTIANS
jgi:hypothetical protein